MDENFATTISRTDTSTRRRFLATGAVLGVASLSSTWLAAAEDSLILSNDDPVRVLVIGSGARGSDLIRALATIQGAAIVGVADDYPPHLAKGLEYAGKQAAGFDDYRVALKQLRPHAVVIAVPLHLHYQVCLDALAAKCAVFCEKTLCATLEDSQKLFDAIQSEKAVFQIGLQRHANPIYVQAQAMIESGMLGQITAIKAQWHRHNSWRRPLPVARNHADWGKLEQKLNWRLYKAYSGGLMTELGSHQLDVVNWCLGSLPQRVFASGGIDFWRDGRDVYDNIFCQYEYEMQPVVPAALKPTPNDPKSAAEAAAAPKPYTVRVTYSSLCNNAYEGAAELIMGTRGTLYLTSGKGLFFKENTPKEVQWAAGGDGQQRAKTNAGVITAGQTLKLSNDPWAHRGTPLEIDNDSGDDTRGELVAFLDHAHRKDPATIADAKVALGDAATVLLANQAAEQGGWVEVPKGVRVKVEG